MKNETRLASNFTIISLHGDVDMQYSREARKKILDTLNNKNHLLVDLSKVEYIDSSGVATLVEGFQLAQTQQLRFALIGVSNAVMMVLKLAHLHKVLPIFDDADAAYSDAN